MAAMKAIKAMKAMKAMKKTLTERQRSILKQLIHCRGLMKKDIRKLEKQKASLQKKLEKLGVCYQRYRRKFLGIKVIQP